MLPKVNGDRRTKTAPRLQNEAFEAYWTGLTVNSDLKTAKYAWFRNTERRLTSATKDCSKNNSVGLKSIKLKLKAVLHYKNTDNRARCPVRLYMLYLSKCPQQSNNNGFYLKPLQNPYGNIWYSCVLLGHNTSECTIKSMCKSAEVTGYKTNHSLHATATTRLYHAGVDEQLIMERTGHKSLDRVRSYNRTSAKQQEYLSDILGLSNKKLKT